MWGRRQGVSEIKLGEVAFADHGDVVGGVTGDEEGEGADAEVLFVGDAGAEPSLFGHVLEERERREADALELFDVGLPWDGIGAGGGGGGVGVVALERRGEAAGEPEGAEGEGALGVGDVVEDLADAPLVSGVAVEGGLFGDGGEEAHGVFELVGEDFADVGPFDLVDVLEVGRSGFVG